MESTTIIFEVCEAGLELVPLTTCRGTVHSGFRPPGISLGPRTTSDTSRVAKAGYLTRFVLQTAIILLGEAVGSALSNRIGAKLVKALARLA
jgi:hypothetical protein